MRTRLTELLEIERPIVSAPLNRMSGGTLAAAVSEAGGLGTFGGAARALRVSPSYIGRELEKIRTKTSKPYGVGFLTHNLPYAAENFDLVIDEDVPVLLFSFGDPTDWIARARAAGRKTVCQVQSIDNAQVAVDAGADVLAVQGNEAGGHTGRQNLLPFLVEVLERFPETPAIAAGGITSGRSLAAVLAAGADGAWMGSAFLTATESTELTDEFKAAVIKADYGDTVHSKVFDIVNEAALGDVAWPVDVAARVKRNDFTDRWHGREAELSRRVAEVAPAYLDAARSSNVSESAVFVGEGAGAVRTVRPVAEIIEEICTEAADLLTERTRFLLG